MQKVFWQGNYLLVMQVETEGVMKSTNSVNLLQQKIKSITFPLSIDF